MKKNAFACQVFRKILMFRVYLIIGAIGLFSAYSFGLIQWGKSIEKGKAAIKIIEITKESNRISNETKKKEQSLDVIQLDNSLCDLGIVRSNIGC